MIFLPKEIMTAIFEFDPTFKNYMNRTIHFLEYIHLLWIFDKIEKTTDERQPLSFSTFYFQNFQLLQIQYKHLSNTINSLSNIK
jgi:hypothetical protein